DRKPHRPEGQVDGLRAIVTRAYRHGFIIGLGAAPEAEQVDLVIAPAYRAVRADHQAGIIDTVGVGTAQGQRASHQPYPVPARLLGQEVLDRTAAGRFTDGEFIAVL